MMGWRYLNFILGNVNILCGVIVSVYVSLQQLKLSSECHPHWVPHTCKLLLSNWSKWDSKGLFCTWCINKQYTLNLGDCFNQVRNLILNSVRVHVIFKRSTSMTSDDISYLMYLIHFLCSSSSHDLLLLTFGSRLCRFNMDTSEYSFFRGIFSLNSSILSYYFGFSFDYVMLSRLSAFLHKVHAISLH